jgi:hypothetical protein
MAMLLSDPGEPPVDCPTTPAFSLFFLRQSSAKCKEKIGRLELEEAVPR